MISSIVRGLQQAGMAIITVVFGVLAALAVAVAFMAILLGVVSLFAVPFTALIWLINWGFSGALTFKQCLAGGYLIGAFCTLFGGTGKKNS